ncbi:hypothetical protein NOGI109294_23615 [Nocardiopsis gilva]
MSWTVRSRPSLRGHVSRERAVTPIPNCACIGGPMPDDVLLTEPHEAGAA